MTVTVPSWLLSTYGGWNNLGVVARFVPLNDPTMGCTQIVEAGLSEPMPLATTSFEMQRMLQERELCCMSTGTYVFDNQPPGAGGMPGMHDASATKTAKFELTPNQGRSWKFYYELSKMERVRVKQQFAIQAAV